MGGFFGVVSKKDCVFDLFFGTDYHSHLGTKRGGMAVYDQEKGFDRAIHNIQNSPFRTKFERDVDDMHGTSGIGCISDTEPQPLIVRSHLGNYAITTVGRINNIDALVQQAFEAGIPHFQEMSGGSINPTELTAALINQKDTIEEGIRHAQTLIEGSMSMLLLTPEGLYAARDYVGRTPVVIGKKEGAHCASFESSAFLNLGYDRERELGPGEIVFVTANEVKTLLPARDEMKICTFLWVYFGYPTSVYEGVNVETMRCRCGEMLAKRDPVEADSVAGIPDSGIAHAIGYANSTGIPFSRPFIKYTPTWPRSFMPQKQQIRSFSKLNPVTFLNAYDNLCSRSHQFGFKHYVLVRIGAAKFHKGLFSNPRQRIHQEGFRSHRQIQAGQMKIWCLLYHVSKGSDVVYCSRVKCRIGK